MHRDNMKRLRKEQIYSLIISFAVIFALGYGIYSVVHRMNGDTTDNIVKLSDAGENNVALKTEDVTDSLPGDIAGNSNPDMDAEAANAGASMQKKQKEQSDGVTAQQPQSTMQEMQIQEKAKDVASDSVTAKQAAIDAAYTFGEQDHLLRPVAGDIILKYSMDSTIYFPTLAAYKCNPAIHIGAEEGSNVGVAANGIVTGVRNSEETGLTIDVAIGNGYTTTYGLMKDVTVKQGDTVVVGQLLGKVAAPTAYYTKEGANLYFALAKDGQPIDPAMYFGE